MRSVAWLWQALLAAMMVMLVAGPTAAIPAVDPFGRVKRSPWHGGTWGCKPIWACQNSPPYLG
uniref:Amp n=1 Tax=Scylla paramamosain TaxID=85552 RepID=A0A7G6KSY9_SCYPA|nr:amp [Scylla paramamosain]